MDGFRLKNFGDDGKIVTVSSEDGKSVQGSKLVLGILVKFSEIEVN